MYVLMKQGKGYMTPIKNPEPYTNNVEEAAQFTTRTEALAARMGGEVVMHVDEIVKNK